MSETQGTERELHDDLVESRGDELFGRYLELPCLLQTVIGCGAAAIAFVLGAIAWALLVAIL